MFEELPEGEYSLHCIVCDAKAHYLRTSASGVVCYLCEACKEISESIGRRCQCEDSNHLLSLPPHDPDHPTHPYTDLFYNLEPVKTAYGTLLMCPACAEHARKDGR